MNLASCWRQNLSVRDICDEKGATMTITRINTVPSVNRTESTQRNLSLVRALSFFGTYHFRLRELIKNLHCVTNAEN
jgi:hypothetical protein